MIARARRGRLAGAVLAVGACVAIGQVGAGGPADAAISGTNLATPTQAAPATVRAVPVKGSFTVDRGSKRIDLTIVREDPAPDVEPVATTVKAFADGPADDWTITSAVLPTNGRWSVTATFTNDDPVTRDLRGNTRGCNPNPCTKVLSNAFFLLAKPAVPANVKVQLVEDRTVKVSWDADTEPDLTHYVIERRVGGGDWAFLVLTDPSEHPAFADQSAPAGSVDYRVSADIEPWDGKDEHRALSDPSATATVKDVPPPPTTTTSTTVPGATTAPPLTNAPPVTAGAASTIPNPAVTKGNGSADLGSLTNALKRAKQGNVPVPTTQLPDGTYVPVLPYTEPDEVLEDGEVQAPAGLQGSNRTLRESTDRPPIVYGAAALLLVVIAMHGLWVREALGRLKDPSEGPDPAGDAVPMPAGPAGAWADQSIAEPNREAASTAPRLVLEGELDPVTPLAPGPPPERPRRRTRGAARPLRSGAQARSTENG